MDTDVSEYVKPAVDYLKQTLKMAQSTSQSIVSKGDYNAVADRLTDTLNLEVIEPVLRVYRAYKHSVKAPHCQEHLMCLVNRHPDQGKQGLPGFKAGLTKLSSLAASAALSFQNGKGFWDLYNAIQNDVNCEAKYPADCASFHEHEMKVTTEVYHMEL
nr:similar to CG8420 [Papilio xuthus]